MNTSEQPGISKELAEESKKTLERINAKMADADAADETLKSLEKKLGPAYGEEEEGKKEEITA